MTTALIRICIYVEAPGVVVNRDTARGSKGTARYLTVPISEAEQRATELARDAVRAAVERIKGALAPAGA